MKEILRPNCCQLGTAVYSLGLVLTAVYLMAGLGGVVWFVICHTDESAMVVGMRDMYMMKMETMMGSLALMGAVLVITFVGLLTCLLLVLGVKTEQRLLLLPWQLYHATIILACFGGGLYQSVHYTVLAEREDAFLACLALFPVVGGIFFIFLWVLVHQLAIRLRYRRQVDRVLEEKRASLASIHLSLPRQSPQNPDIESHRSVKSIRTLKRRREGARSRCQSEEHILTATGAGTVESPYYWVANRSRSLPRNLERTGDRDDEMRFANRDNTGMFEYQNSRKYKTLDRSETKKHTQYDYEIPKCSTDKSKQRSYASVLTSDYPDRTSDTITRKTGQSNTARRRHREADMQASSHSLHSTKSVTIHPEVTQFSYPQFIPRTTLAKEANVSTSTFPINSDSSSSENETDERHFTDNEDGIKEEICLEHAEQVSDMKDPHRDTNYLAFSDTDTVECYTVPSPIYPTLPHQKERWTPITHNTTRCHISRHQIINLYSTPGDRGR